MPNTINFPLHIGKYGNVGTYRVRAPNDRIHIQERFGAPALCGQAQSQGGFAIRFGAMDDDRETRDRLIKSARESGASIDALADQYGLAASTIRRIANAPYPDPSDDGLTDDEARERDKRHAEQLARAPEFVRVARKMGKLCGVCGERWREMPYISEREPGHYKAIEDYETARRNYREEKRLLDELDRQRQADALQERIEADAQLEEKRKEAAAWAEYQARRRAEAARPSPPLVDDFTAPEATAHQHADQITLGNDFANDLSMPMALTTSSAGKRNQVIDVAAYLNRPLKGQTDFLAGIEEKPPPPSRSDRVPTPLRPASERKRVAKKIRGQRRKPSRKWTDDDMFRMRMHGSGF